MHEEKPHSKAERFVWLRVSIGGWLAVLEPVQRENITTGNALRNKFVYLMEARKQEKEGICHQSHSLFKGIP